MYRIYDNKNNNSSPYYISFYIRLYRYNLDVPKENLKKLHCREFTLLNVAFYQSRLLKINRAYSHMFIILRLNSFETR